MSHLVKKISNMVPKFGVGSWVYTECGKKILDYSSGIGAISLGHAHPRVTKAIQDQAAQMTLIQHNCWNNPLENKFWQKMHWMNHDSDKWKMKFLTNSGSEAVEQTLKFFMKTSGRNKIVSVVNGFHGRTIKASSLSTSIIQSYFPKENSLIINLDDDYQIGPDVAAIIVEPIQGEGGINVIDIDKLLILRNKAKQVGAKFIVDEIQSGCGRTGSWYAHDSRLDPDALTFGKAVANGAQLAGILFKEKVEDPEYMGFFGGTYNGNALSLASAIETLNVIDNENLLSDVRQKGIYLKKELENIFGEENVFGKGFMLAFRPTNVSAYSFRGSLLHIENVLTLPAGGDTLVRVLPPFNTTPDEIDIFLQRVRRVSLYKMISMNDIAKILEVEKELKKFSVY